MVVPDEVLDLASRTNRMLAKAHRQLRELAATGKPAPDEIVRYCDGPLLDHLTEMRRVMRADPGVDTSTPPARNPHSLRTGTALRR